MPAIKPRHKPAFYVSHEAWYSDTRPRQEPEIMLGFYDVPGGGSPGEFALRWYPLGKDRLVARLEIYQDSWIAFRELDTRTGLLAALAEYGDELPQPEDMKALLLRLGFEDITSRTTG